MSKLTPNLDQWIWTEKYRPQTLEDCILPEKIKTDLIAFKEKGNLPNVIFAGSAGIGKTSVAKAFCKELDLDYMFLQGSGKDRGIDTIRTKMEKFATAVSWDDSDRRKVVIIDEADNLTLDAQLALRTFIEENADNCGFIFTANYPGRFTEALLSRMHVIEFRIPKNEKTKLAIQFLKRLILILKAEGIEDYNQEVLKKLAERYFPDMRRIINALQNYSATGRIDEGVLDYIKRADCAELIEFMKEREWNKMRKWVGENVDDPAEVILDLFQNGHKYFKMQSLPQAILCLNDAQKDHVIAIDKQLSLVANLTRIMSEVEFE